MSENKFQRMPKISREDVELDKSADGTHWVLLRWLNADILLRLKFVYTCGEDPTDFVAEVKVVDDTCAGQTEEGFTRVGSFGSPAVRVNGKWRNW